MFTSGRLTSALICDKMGAGGGVMANKWDTSDVGKAYHKEYASKNIRFTMRFFDDKIPKLLPQSASAKGISQAEYLRRAVLNKMRKDGVLEEKISP